MQTTTPTTREELLNALHNVYTFYRREKTEFKEIEFIPLNLWRMNDTPKTEKELVDEATLLLASKHKREYEQVKSELEEKIELLNDKIVFYSDSRILEEKNIDEIYAKALLEAEKTALKNGVASSELFSAQLIKINKEKLSKKQEISASYQEKIILAQSELKILQNKPGGLEKLYQEIHSLEVTAKAKELEKEDKERVEKAEKYNSTVDEKEQDYKNEILETNARLKISFLDIENRDFSKDELIQMGYYKSVIDLVCNYLNAMEPLPAYEEFKEINELVFYLDHYYEILNNTYQMRTV